MKDDILFLNELQNELNTQENDGQAAPIFWSIMDYKCVPTSEDHSDNVILYDQECCSTIEINDYVEDIIDFEGDRHLEFDSEQRNELSERHRFNDPQEVFEWIEENDDDSRYYPVYQQELSFIAYNTCFFTKNEAKQHLEGNKHHYSDKAHTFAMTAWRAPKMERLMKILESFDWDSVKQITG